MRQTTSRCWTVACGIIALAAWWAVGGDVARSADADEEPTCEHLWEHALEMARAIPEGAAELDAIEPDDLEQSRTRFMQRCGGLTPEARACAMARKDVVGMERCADEYPAKAAYGVKVLANLDAIRNAELVHHARSGAFMACDPTPPTVPGLAPAPFAAGGLQTFQALGWLPDGPVRCSYSVVGITTGPPDGFTALAECDFDGDGLVELYRTTRDERPAEADPWDVSQALVGTGACEACLACCRAYVATLGLTDGVPEAVIAEAQRDCESINELRRVPDSFVRCNMLFEKLKGEMDSRGDLSDFVAPEECR
jgi:hypothetical protein